jgi:hypothetical protein
MLSPVSINNRQSHFSTLKDGTRVIVRRSLNARGVRRQCQAEAYQLDYRRLAGSTRADEHIQPTDEIEIEPMKESAFDLETRKHRHSLRQPLRAIRRRCPACPRLVTDDESPTVNQQHASTFASSPSREHFLYFLKGAAPRRRRPGRCLRPAHGPTDFVLRAGGHGPAG